MPHLQAPFRVKQKSRLLCEECVKQQTKSHLLCEECEQQNPRTRPPALNSAPQRTQGTQPGLGVTHPPTHPPTHPHTRTNLVLRVKTKDLHAVNSCSVSKTARCKKKWLISMKKKFGSAGVNHSGEHELMMYLPPPRGPLHERSIKSIQVRNRPAVPYPPLRLTLRGKSLSSKAAPASFFECHPFPTDAAARCVTPFRFLAPSPLSKNLGRD